MRTSRIKKLRLSPRGSQGLFLVQALVWLLILSLIGSMTLEFALGRNLIVRKMTGAEKRRSLAQSLESRVYDCLAQRSFLAGRAVCDPACSMSQLINDTPVSASVGGSPCVITIEVTDGGNP